MNGLHFFFGLGAFISPIIIAQTVLISGDITWAYWALALLILPTILWLVRLPSPTLPEVSTVSIEHVNNNLTGPSKSTLITLIALFFFLFVGAEVSFGGWIFTYTTTLNLGNATSAAYLTSAYWGALTLGRLLTIPVAIHLRPRTILLVDLIGCLVSILFILLKSNSTTVLWIGTLGMGFFMASMFPTLFSLAGRRMQITGRITGWFFVGVGAGGMIVPWVIGQLFETIGPHITLLTILVDLILAVVVFIVLMLRSPEPAVSNTS
jgi:FHS family Na+ dependent glucose MFS transporter 1